MSPLFRLTSDGALLDELLRTLGTSEQPAAAPPLFSDHTINAILGNDLRDIAAEIETEMQKTHTRTPIFVQQDEQMALEKQGGTTGVKSTSAGQHFQTLQQAAEALGIASAIRPQPSPTLARASALLTATGSSFPSLNQSHIAAPPNPAASRGPLVAASSLIPSQPAAHPARRKMTIEKPAALSLPPLPPMPPARPPPPPQHYIAILNGQIVQRNGTALLTTLPPGTRQLTIQLPGSGSVLQYIPVLNSSIVTPKQQAVPATPEQLLASTKQLVAVAAAQQIKLAQQQGYPTAPASMMPPPPPRLPQNNNGEGEQIAIPTLAPAQGPPDDGTVLVTARPGHKRERSIGSANPVVADPQTAPTSKAQKGGDEIDPVLQFLADDVQGEEDRNVDVDLPGEHEEEKGEEEIMERERQSDRADEELINKESDTSSEQEYNVNNSDGSLFSSALLSQESEHLSATDITATAIMAATMANSQKAGILANATHPKLMTECRRAPLPGGKRRGRPRKDDDDDDIIKELREIPEYAALPPAEFKAVLRRERNKYHAKISRERQEKLTEVNKEWEPTTQPTDASRIDG